MKITIVGTGYVGLVTGACFSEIGIDVTCIDIDEAKVNNLRKGIMPIYEPGLDQLIDRNVNKGRLKFSTQLSDSLNEADLAFIAVGTPSDAEGSADLTYVLTVADDIGKILEKYCVIVIKSTVPVGTAYKVRERILLQQKKRGVSIPFDIVSNPEFLKEGAAINDFLKPDRIVIGVESDKARAIIKSLYRPFILNGHPIIFMDLASSEMTKYAANALLATKISFMNEIANLCEIVEADVNLVRQGIGSDPRIGDKFIYPGIGYGGSCFPKDVRALINTANLNNYNMDLLKAVDSVNNRQKDILFKKIEAYYGAENLTGKHFALWGVSFKPNTDDIREAPALNIINSLKLAGVTITVYDPEAMDQCEQIFGNGLTYADNIYDAVKNADALIIATEWSEFRCPDFEIIKNHLIEPVIFDGRNIFDREKITEMGFNYHGIGLANNSSNELTNRRQAS